MIVRWFGHNCFLFYSKRGSRIVTDPFSENCGFVLPPLSCEIVTISHEHQNHNAVWRISGSPYVIRRTNPGYCELEIPLPITGETFLFKGVPTYHDEFSGRTRGPNTVFVWEMDGYRIGHLGDLGHELNQSQVESIGTIDVLLVPVGGGGRILDSKRACSVVKSLGPSIVVPMQYSTPQFDAELEPVENFLTLMSGVKSVDSNQFELSSIPDQLEVIHLKLPQRDTVGS